MNDTLTQWLNDAPDPDAVLTRVLTLVARQVKTMSDSRLRQEDHTGRMRVLLAAEFYFDLYDQVVNYRVPDAALEVADLHLRFANHALGMRVEGESTEAMEALATLADECFVSRGRICPGCGLPQCLHLSPDGLRPQDPDWSLQQE